MSTTAAVALATTIPGEHVRIAVNKDTEPFWNAAKERRLAVPQCADCQTFRLPPTPFCPNCQSKMVNLVMVPAVLDLPDAPGARLVSNIVDVAPQDVTIGMSVRVDFSPISDGWLLPVFRLEK
jgi:uncharacterized OB-fold protein